MVSIIPGDTLILKIGRLTGELEPLCRLRGMLSRCAASWACCRAAQPGCAALRATQFGAGPVTSVAIWAELGRTNRETPRQRA